MILRNFRFDYLWLVLLFLKGGWCGGNRVREKEGEGVKEGGRGRMSVFLCVLK